MAPPLLDTEVSAECRSKDQSGTGRAGLLEGTSAGDSVANNWLARYYHATCIHELAVTRIACCTWRRALSELGNQYATCCGREMRMRRRSI